MWTDGVKTPMRRFVMALLSCLLVACGDKDDVTPIVTFPSVTIVSPSDGDELIEDVPVLLQGLVQDRSFEDELETLTPLWSVGGETVCPEAVVDSNGETTCTHAFEPGTDVLITLKVTNPTGGASAYDVLVNVLTNAAPGLVVSSPVPAGKYYSDSKVEFEAYVSDDRDDPEELVVAWDSDLDGVLTALEGAPSSSGYHGGAALLSQGQHSLSVTVTDTGGKTTKENLLITVGIPNTPPTCEILNPLDGDVLAFGESLEFQGLTADVDVASNTLTYEWHSDVDGRFASGSPTSAGDILVNFSGLTRRSHIISLTVQDDAGASCTDQVNIQVGSAPVLTLTEPVSGAVYNEGEVVHFKGSVSDAEDVFTDIAMSWVSVGKDGEFSTQGADSLGTLVFSTNTLSSGSHTIQVTATDTDGLVAVVGTTIYVNAVPTQPTVELIPDPATTVDDLTGTLVTPSTDADGHAILYSYAWYKDGALTTHSTATVPSSATARGQNWRIEVTPSDLYGSGPMDSDALTIQNALPVLSTVALTPDPASVTDTLACTPGTVSDGDGDSVGYQYAWSVNGSAVAASTATLSSSFFAKGQSVVCTVTPFDAYGSGDAVVSNLVTIINSPPVLDSVTLTPGSPVEASTLLCSPGTSSDADGDTVTVGYQWYVNGVGISATSGTLTGTDFDKTDDVYCVATPNDGAVDGTPVSSNVVLVENTPPVLASVGITPTTAYETSSFTCAPGSTSDDDLDTVVNTIHWTVNGVKISATGTTLTGSDFDKDDSVACLVTPNDGTEDGAAVSSPSVTVLNTLPVLADVTLTPDPAYEVDLLKCTPGLTTDADADVISYSYEWMVDSTLLGVTTDTLSGTYFDRGDVVLCTATPEDDDGAGSPVDSNVVVIENSIPVLLSVSLAPTTPYEDSTLRCTPGTSSDDDIDLISFEYDWVVNGVSTGVGTSTLTGSYFDRGDSVYCEATPYDSLDVGTTVSSNTVVVANSPPSVLAPSLSPTVAYEVTTLNCLSGLTSDVDGDTVTVSTSWKVNGATIGLSGSTLDGANFDRGDTVVCRLTPNDGSIDGTGVDSNAVTIQNSKPSVNSASIAPTLPFTDDALSVTVSGVSDDDADSVSYTYQWYVNGVAVSSGGTGAALAASLTTKDDLVYVVVTPYDGVDNGSSVTSGLVTISNTPPEAPVVDLVPDDAEPADDLICDIDVDGYDEDGDTLYYTYAWARNGTLTGFTTRTLSYVNTTDGDTWTCYATPNDGDDTGPAGFDRVVVADRTAPDRPIIGSIERYRNDGTVNISGSAEAYASVVLYVSCDDGSSTAYTTTASVLGLWSITATQTAGLDCEYYAVATDTAGNLSPDSNTVSTEVCDPGDDYELFEQNSCADPVSDWSDLASDGLVTITIDGNIVDGSDSDWYHINTLQSLTWKSGYYVNNYNLEIALTTGSADYDFLVYRGGCASSDVECGTSGSDTYDYSAVDKGTADHSVPSDPASCRNGSNYYNDCANFASDIYIKVIRTSAFNCNGYTMNITNGK